MSLEYWSINIFRPAGPSARAAPRLPATPQPRFRKRPCGPKPQQPHWHRKSGWKTGPAAATKGRRTSSSSGPPDDWTVGVAGKSDGLKLGNGTGLSGHL